MEKRLIFILCIFLSHYIYAEDLGYGSLAALEEKSTNKTITLAAKENTKIVDLAKMIIKITKKNRKNGPEFFFSLW